GSRSTRGTAAAGGNAATRGRAGGTAAGEPAVLRRLSRREGHEMALPNSARRRRQHDRGDDVRSDQRQREDRSEEVRGTEMTGIIALALFIQQAAGSTLRVTVSIRRMPWSSGPPSPSWEPTLRQ